MRIRYLPRTYSRRCAGRLSVVLLTCLFISGTACCNAAEMLRELGVLELPPMAVNTRNELDPALSSLVVQERPSQTRSNSLRLTYWDVEIRELTEDKPPVAVVLQRKGHDWYCLALAKQGSKRCLWRRDPNQAHFSSLRSCIEGEEMAYLTGDWDGVLFKAPGSSETVPHPEVSRRVLSGVLMLERREALGPDIGSRTFSLPLYKEPGESSAILRWVSSESPQDSVQQINTGVAYFTDTTPLAVIEERDGWFKVAEHSEDPDKLKRYGWLRPSARQGRFRHFTDAKERQKALEAVYGRLETSVAVRETKVIKGALWARVDIRRGVCSPMEPSVIGSAWVPVNPAGRRTAIWFHSRGC